MKKQSMGIYKIENIVNGHIYIGSSSRLNLRWKEHSNFLKRGAHPNIILQRAWDKYGDKNFKFVVIEKIKDENDLLIKEQWYLDNWKPEYNIAEYADAPMRGRTFSEEVIERLREANLGKTIPDDVRKKISKTMKGKKKSPEHIKKVAEANKGRIVSDETRRKLSESKKGAGLGRKLSKETRKNMSKAQKGRIVTQEVREKIRASLLGTHLSDETKDKLSKIMSGKGNPFYGKQHSENTKRKLSLAKSTKLDENKVREIRRLYAAGNISQKALGKQFNVNQQTVSEIIRREIWDTVE